MFSTRVSGLCTLWVLFLLICLTSISWAESSHEPPSVKAMKQRLAQVNVNVSKPCAQPTADSPVLTLLVHWTAYQSSRPLISPGGASPAPGGGFYVLSSKPESGTITLPKSAELSSDELVIAAVNPMQQLCGWAIAPDPRTVRAEQSGPDQVLQGRILHRTATSFLVSIPNAPD